METSIGPGRRSAATRGGRTRPQTSTDPLVEALAIRLRRIDLVAWQRIASWAEQFGLSFAHLRVLLAVTAADGPVAVSDLAKLAGLSLHLAYPAVHNLSGRRFLREERRRYALTEDGQDLVAALDAAHREGVQAYVDNLDPDERRRLDALFGIAR